MVRECGLKSIKLKTGALDSIQEANDTLVLAPAFPCAPPRIDPNANSSMPTALKRAEHAGAR